MPSWLPSIPYPPPDQPGYWDPVTSTLQWCEEDYYATYYSAEITNTLTNLMYWYCAYQGVSSCRRNGHDRVFQIAYYGYFLVGFGSFMFHSTLKYPWQLVDELNMIYTTCLMIYASLSYRKTTPRRIGLGVAGITFCAAVTGWYHVYQNPVFHQSVFAAMTVWLVARSAWLMEINLRPYWKRRQGREDRSTTVVTTPLLNGTLGRNGNSHSLGHKHKHNHSESNRERGRDGLTRDEKDMKILKRMWILVIWGISVFLTGFALWGLDNVYCSTLRSWRRTIGLPWGILLEGHGWWHLFTGYGAYCYIVWGIHLRHILNGRQDEYVLVWRRSWSLPEIVRISSSQIDAKAVNGRHVHGKAVNGYIDGHAGKKAVNGHMK